MQRGNKKSEYDNDNRKYPKEMVPAAGDWHFYILSFKRIKKDKKPKADEFKIGHKKTGICRFLFLCY